MSNHHTVQTFPLPLLCRIAHKWLLNKVRSNSHNTYTECVRFGARRVAWPNGGYQPVDSDWLKGELK